MKFIKIIPIILLLFQPIDFFGQSIEFSYDANGNRLSRTLVVERLKSATIQFPVTDPKSLNPVDNKVALVPEEGEINAVVYPNPNKGLIKIDITNMPLNSNKELRLYDLSGAELIVKRNFESYSEMDISRFKDGIYILRIKINEKVFDWKVIKSH
jgi:Secretion system C-terminal sorting domain